MSDHTKAMGEFDDLGRLCGALGASFTDNTFAPKPWIQVWRNGSLWVTGYGETRASAIRSAVQRIARECFA